MKTSHDESRDRKAEHIELSLRPDVQHRRNYFDDYRFDHVALPEIDYSAIDTSTPFLGKRLGAPLLISSMTGGTFSAGAINRNLARAAESRGVALGLGSQRKAIEDPSQADTFRVRSQAPTIPVLANVGAVQLNYGFGISECRRIVDMAGADALILHLNPLQEVLQPEGQTNFASLLPKIEGIVRQLEVPVIVKEIGCGLSETLAQRLVSIGVTVLDTAGVGGTSWAKIESYRSGEMELGELFAGWGIPTPESIEQLRRIPGITVIGSGGIRSGLDVAKAIAIGADVVGLASPLLPPALESAEAVGGTLDRIVQALKIAMFCVGAKSIDELKRAPLVHRDEGKR